VKERPRLAINLQRYALNKKAAKAAKVMLLQRSKAMRPPRSWTDFRPCGRARMLWLSTAYCGNAAAPAPLHSSVFSLGLNQISDDRCYVGLIDRRLVEVDHFVDLGLPDRLRKFRLVQHHAGRMTGHTVVVDGVSGRPTREHPVAGRQVGGLAADIAAM
jgi:hypothetical protein